jgi:hypothetical protein
VLIFGFYPPLGSRIAPDNRKEHRNSLRKPILSEADCGSLGKDFANPRLNPSYPLGDGCAGISSEGANR